MVKREDINVGDVLWSFNSFPHGDGSAWPGYVSKLENDHVTLIPRKDKPLWRAGWGLYQVYHTFQEAVDDHPNINVYPPSKSITDCLDENLNKIVKAQCV